jgi:hypothetical protein
MSDLSDFEERVLGVLDSRTQLELEQVAGAARLSARAAGLALRGLQDRELVTASKGRYGELYALNRRAAQERTAAA